MSENLKSANPSDWTVSMETTDSGILITMSKNDGKEWAQIELDAIQTATLIESLQKHLSEIKTPTND